MHFCHGIFNYLGRRSEVQTFLSKFAMLLLDQSLLNEPLPLLTWRAIINRDVSLRENQIGRAKGGSKKRLFAERERESSRAIKRFVRASLSCASPALSTLVFRVLYTCRAQRCLYYCLPRLLNTRGKGDSRCLTWNWHGWRHPHPLRAPYKPLYPFTGVALIIHTRI